MIRRLCSSAAPDGRNDSFEVGLWSRLGELGVLSIGTPEAGGGATEMVACVEELGAAAIAGPLAETFMSIRVLPAAAAKAIAGGERVATVTWNQTTVPWGAVADMIVFFDSGMHAWLCDSDSHHLTPTLAGDLWSRATLTKRVPLGGGDEAVAVGELAIAAYVLGAAVRLVEMAADYAHNRMQFGRAIGQFQAVAHPLAVAWSRLAAVQDLLPVVAAELDHEPDRSETGARAARLRLCATQAANDAVYVALQVHGGMGFVADTVPTRLARRIRQASISAVPLEHSRRRALAG
jgi:alkylation response protein AidB-like acyl-CoA dehydrogenase